MHGLRRRRFAISIASTAIAFGLTTPAAVAAVPADSTRPAVTAAEATPGLAPSNADDVAVYLDMNGNVIDPSQDGAAPHAADFGCTPVSGHDNPHRSSTGVVVSGHGWWGKGNCTNDRANVQNCLYEFYTDNTWRQKACSAVTELSPGSGGSGRRTNARVNCSNTASTSWRNHVDVDVIGEVDTGEAPYRQQDVLCRVF